MTCQGESIVEEREEVRFSEDTLDTSGVLFNFPPLTVIVLCVVLWTF